MKRTIIKDQTAAELTVKGLNVMGKTFSADVIAGGGWQFLVAENAEEAAVLSQLKERETMQS